MGFQMSLLEYRQIRQRLNRIVPAAEASQNILQLLRVFCSEPQQKQQKQQQQHQISVNEKSEIDAFGRVSAMGRRKSSLAKVTIIPGNGECLVNGVQLCDYFPRYRDVFEISRPLSLVKQFGKFNIWALTRGGGMTGKRHCPPILVISF